MLRQLLTATRSVLAMLVVFGLLFPLLITAVARMAFPHQARGSLLATRGRVIGSELIGQNFASPGYFHPRPSAAGSGYDAASSGGTNLGPTSDKLVHGVHQKLPNGRDDPNSFAGVADLAAAYRRENGLAPNALVPADAVTRSGSGLDPDISPANAYAQVARVAKARHLREDRVRGLVAANVAGRQLGFLGEPRVNVLQLNLALDGEGTVRR
jgi:potassium-transporting ATPase KdpC subunit